MIPLKLWRYSLLWLHITVEWFPSNVSKSPQLPRNSTCSRGCTHGKENCRKYDFGGRGRMTIPAAADCSFSAFSSFYPSPKHRVLADVQTVNLGITFGLFFLHTHFGERSILCGVGESYQHILYAFGSSICSVSSTKGYQTVHKIFCTNWLHISSDSDIIKMKQVTKGGTRSCRLLQRN